jgi:hypothetical protein
MINKAGLTIASSEQEAASTLGSFLETVSRCLLSLTQAFAESRGQCHLFFTW